jgi:hypothetical protein
MAPACGHAICRAYQLTVSEFERLGGEAWTQSFRVSLGLRAATLYAELYGKKAKKVRSSTKPEWRNRVGKYPCGILEQAYRELRSKAAVASPARDQEPDGGTGETQVAP